MSEYLEKVVFLAAYTSRSRAYAQAMLDARLEPESIVLFGTEGGNLPGQTGSITCGVETSGEGTLFLPDHSIPLKESCGLLSDRVQEVKTDNVNDPALIHALRQAAPRLVIYSGYGAQIVGPHALDVASFLHVHSGWLPDERGSTTMYYGWLEKGRCGVSAILMADQIDTGPIVARREYPPPPPGVDPDHVYDGAIRADLLVRVLNEYREHGKFASSIPQSAEGRSYYVIHPVLKHLARLKGKNEQPG